MSRSGPWLLLAACAAGPAEGQMVAIDYRLPPVSDPPMRLEVRAGCLPATSEDEIVVCGSRDEDRRYRVASEPVPGARRRLIAGEPPSAVAALADGTPSRCTTVGPNQQCTGGLDIFAIGFGIARLIARARANRD